MSNSQVAENTNKSAESKNSGEVRRGAAGMAIGTLLSRVLGLGREVLIFAFFPTFVTDAFVVALRLPNMFRRLLGEGSLSVAFIPSYVDTLKKHGEERAASLSSGVFTLLCVVSLVVCALGIIFMQLLVELITSGKGYSSVPGKMQFTVYLGRIMFSFIFLMSLYAYFMALLQSYKVFSLPAMAPALFNLSLIACILLPSDLFAVEGEVLAWAVIVGGAAQLGLLLPRVLKMGLMPRFAAWWNDVLVKKVLITMMPSMLGNGILQITGFANIYFASQLAEGTHSYIYLADRILELPLGLFAVSIGSALLPTLAGLWSEGKVKELVETNMQSLRLMFFIALPCALGMWFLAQPIVEVIFLYGKFSNSSAVTTAQVVQLYAVSLIIASSVRVLVPSFYAMKNTWLPATASVCGLLVHILGAQYWMSLWGVKGLVFSTVLGSAFNLFFVSIAYKKQFGSFPLFSLLKVLLPFSLCGLVMTGFIYSFDSVFAYALGFVSAVKLTKAVLLGVYIGIAALIYFSLASLLKIPEGEQVVATFRRKLGR